MRQDPSGRPSIREQIQALMQQGNFEKSNCDHLEQLQDVTPSADGCEDCLKIGDVWVNLRLCLICGHVGCCDNSKNKHATKHFHQTGHPLIVSYEEGENWVWCYADEELFDL